MASLHNLGIRGAKSLQSSKEPITFSILNPSISLLFIQYKKQLS
jgi:hypothetical protein